jgi:hypothetical protein
MSIIPKIICAALIAGAAAYVLIPEFRYAVQYQLVHLLFIHRAAEIDEFKALHLQRH